MKWGRISCKDWKLHGLIYNSARGHKRYLGSVGLKIERGKTPALIGWAYPRSGLDGRRELTHVCAKKIAGVHLASDHPERYPGWQKNDDAVIWLREKLSKRSLDEVAGAVSKRATLFFKIAKPTLNRLAGQR